VITALVCDDPQADLYITKAVRKTLKNKTSRKIKELKGSNTLVTIKKYFFRHIEKQEGWTLYTAIVDKISWVKHHKRGKPIDQNTFYDEATKRLLRQIDFPLHDLTINIVVDRSKNREDREIFNARIREIFKTLPNHHKTLLEINHPNSQETPGLQAVDLFCWGIRRKHQYRDDEWYSVFSCRIATENEIKF
jgi:hypothetical protein